MKSSTRNEIRRPQGMQTFSRRSKGRSRSGCLSCRQRRIKCDEARPRCAKCTKHSFLCHYSAVNPAKAWQEGVVTFTTSAFPHSDYRSSFMRTQPASVKASISSTIHTSVPMVYDVPVVRTPGFGVREFQLLANFVSATSYDILGRQDLWVHDVLQLAIHNNFLMHAMLMTSAEHLQYLNPTSHENYSLQAAQHLQQCLRSFQVALSGSIESISNNIDAIIGTSLLLIIHGWANPKFSHEATIPDGDPVLQHSNGVFHICRRTHSYGTSVIFGPICTPKLVPPIFPTNGPALDLIFMAQSHLPGSEPGDYIKKTYIAVIETLTLLIDAVSSRPNLGDTPPDALLVYFTQWLAFLPTKFIALIEGHDARALVIMAYFYALVGFVLKKTTGWWWMRKRPAYMIRQISNFLNGEWDVWMRWPMEILEKGSDEINYGSMAAEDGSFLTEQGRTCGSDLGILSDVYFHFRKIEVEE